MSFRDEVVATRARRDALRGAISSAQTLHDQTALRRQLAEVLAALDAVRERSGLELLSRVRVAAPCPASWQAMSGDDAVRHCALCDKNVYDFSGHTAQEAAHLLAEHEGGELCARLHRRRDGTLIMGDCEVGMRRRRRRRLALGVAALAAGAIASLPPLPEAPPTAFARIAARPAPARTGWSVDSWRGFDARAFLRGAEVPSAPRRHPALDIFSGAVAGMIFVPDPDESDRPDHD